MNHVKRRLLRNNLPAGLVSVAFRVRRKGDGLVRPRVRGTLVRLYHRFFGEKESVYCIAPLFLLLSHDTRLMTPAICIKPSRPKRSRELTCLGNFNKSQRNGTRHIYPSFYFIFAPCNFENT